jgi:iron complex outermembrane recepter protein
MNRAYVGGGNAVGSDGTPALARWLLIAACVALAGALTPALAADGPQNADGTAVAAPGADGAAAGGQATTPQSAQKQDEKKVEKKSGEEAQAAPPTTVTEVVVVTARKREELVDQVPVAVAAISGDDLTRNDMPSVAAMSQMVPGLNINSDAVTRSFVSIRAIGTALFNTVDPGVGIFQDGVYLPSTAYANNPTLDVDRIEVLKGPQGTMYGKNTLGGAINIVTRKPTDQFEAQAMVDYAGVDNSRDGAARISGALAQGALWGRLAVSSRRSDGFFTNSLIGGPIDSSKSDQGNGSLVWKLSETADITLNGYYLDLSGPQTAYGSPTDIHAFSPDIYKLNVSSSADGTYKGGNLKLALDLPGISSQFTGILAYDGQDESSYADADFSPVDLYRQSGTTHRTSKTVELRLDSSLSSTVSTLFGAFGSDDKQDNGTVTTVVPYNLNVPDSNSQSTDAWAVFGTAFWHPRADWELTLGLRYDENKAVLKAPADVANPRRELTSSHVEPRVSVTKYWTETSMTYFSVARGDREGGFNPTVAPEDLWIIQPDKVWTAEVGEKASFGGGRTHVNGAIFYSDYTNFIGQNTFVLRADGNGYTAAVINEGDATSYGFDGTVTSQFTDRWSAGADVAYVHARATNQDGWIAATGHPLATDRLIFQPDWTFNLRAEYAQPIGSSWLSFRVGLYGKGDSVGATQKAPPDAAPIVPSYYLLNASISFAFKGWQVQLYGTNLTNQDYWASYIDNSLTGFNLGIQGATRKVGLQLIYNWM